MLKKGPGGLRNRRGLALTLANEKAFTNRMLKNWPGGLRNRKKLAGTLASEKAFTKRMLKDSAIFVKGLGFHTSGEGCRVYLPRAC